MTQIEAHIVRDRLSYDPATGIFRWKVRPTNAVRIGDIAGHLGHHGLNIGIDGTYHIGRRLAWIHYYGSIPPGMEVFVLNRDESDLRIANLELSTVRERMERHSMHRGNTLAHGISREQIGAYVRYRAKLSRKGEVVHLSSHRSLDEAISARAAALLKYEETKR